MGARRALIIGSDKDYCYVVKEFLESKGVIANTILDYNQGIDRLFNDNPDITVLEIISSHKISTNLLGKVRGSLDLQIIDDVNRLDIGYQNDKKPVFLLEETSQLNTLLAYLNTLLINNNLSTEEQANKDSIYTQNLKFYPYPILLSYIYKNNISCVLDLNSKVKLRVYFDKGTPVFAEAGDVETALGRMLVNSGTIKDVVEYKNYLKIASEKGQSLGEVLVSKGVISPHELNKVQQKQIIEKLIRGFDLEEGEFKLSRVNDVLSNIVRYDIAFPQMMHEGIKRYIKADSLKYIFYDGEIPRKFILDESISQKSQNIGLGPKDLRVIQDLEKNKDLEKLLKNSTVGKDEILRVLFLIYLIGLLEVENSPYNSVNKIFSNKLENQVDDSGYEIEQIIDLEEEVAEDAKGSVSKEAIDSNKYNQLDYISRKELDMEMNIAASTNKSNVIPFKDQQPLKEDLVTDYPDKDHNLLDEDAKKKSNRLKSDYQKELIDNFNSIFDNVEEKNHYEILGVTSNSSGKQIKDAYYDLVKKYHPDILSSIDRDINDKADHVFAKITVAYQTLIDEDQRAQYDASFELEKLKSQAGILYQAEVQYNEGLALLRQKQYDKAIQRFDKAKEINPDKLIYSSLIAWVNFLKNRENKDSVNKSISVLEKAISQDPTNPDNYYYLGSIYKHLDEIRKAEINFSKAVEHDPDFVDAKRELRVIKNRKTDRKDSKNLKTEKRFWSGIFKK